MKDEMDNLMSFDDMLSTDQHVGMEDKYEMNMNRNMNMRPIFTAWLVEGSAETPSRNG